MARARGNHHGPRAGRLRRKPDAAPMARPKKAAQADEPAGAKARVREYRHDTKRKNLPPAGLAAQGTVEEAARVQYSYDPHLPPVLRFDSDAAVEKLIRKLERGDALKDDERKALAAALRRHDPWLEWAGKRERRGFEVEPVALHIHERVAAQAILKIAAREDVSRSLFADPELEYTQAVQFYQHDMDWTNRLILGDSLEVMASLARREALAGKVQMIYMDPPYGIRFASNFQPQIGKRDVKDKESDLTREPEMVKAYRDTWTLGVHSYLAYLRDRLILCRELLADTGSIFVQISDENLHRVRAVMDDVLGAANYVAQIYFKTTTGRQEAQIDRVGNYLLWYARDMERVKSRKLYLEKDKTEADEAAAGDLQSQGLRTTGSYGVENEGRRFSPLAGNHWKVTEDGMRRVAQSDRILPLKAVIRFKRLQSDFPVQAITDVWTDASGGAGADKVYVVQTGGRIVERCLLMTTDPGDLVLDPTCGSGTTAYVAEQWGRRWLTIDTSRVAVALARQRILTTTFPFFKVKGTNGGDAPVNPSPGFLYKTVPHITLKSIAQNAALDPIFAKHQSILDEKLKALNAVLKRVKKDVRDGLYGKLARKERDEGRKAVTDADRRRWLLPPDNRDRSVKLTVPADFEGWYEWEVPFDADPDWPQEFQDALTAYRQAWRAKMDEVNACIAAHADQEELVDQPEVAKGVVRVAGPFTVEAVMPPEETVDVETPIGGQPEELPTYANAGGQFMSAAPAPAIAGAEPSNAGAYHDKMLRLLKADGVRFPNNKQLAFSRVEACSHGDFIHAEGEWTTEDGKEHRVAVSFGPQLGPVTAVQVEEVLHLASKRGYDDVVFAGFSFDGAAQAAIQGDPNPRVRSHLAHIRPDVNPGMDGLLKETPDSQIFTVFGSPRTDLQKGKDGQYTITMEGVDIYDPVSNTIAATGADKIAAWFVDTDYDGRTFCITQAFFPDKSAWEKLARALKGLIEEDRFAQLSGTVSLSFPAGKHKRAAVKVIDPRGNEVMSVHRLEGKKGYG